MTLADRRSAGWPPCIVDAVEWDGPGGPLGRRDEKWLLSNIVGGRRSLAVIGSKLPVSPTRGLTVVDTSARLCFHLADGQPMPGTDVTGVFRWFDKALIDESPMFSATLESPVRGMCRVFVNAETGQVQRVGRVRPEAMRFSMSDAVTRARLIVDDRMLHHGDNPFYQYADREISRIEARLSQGPKPDRVFYETLTHGIGLMCARELESSDMEFCDAVYAALGQVRAQTL